MLGARSGAGWSRLVEGRTAPRRRPCARIRCVPDAARVRRLPGRPIQVNRQQAGYLKVRAFGVVTRRGRGDRMAGASVSAGAGERLLEALVRTAQQASPVELPTALERYAEAMGMGRAIVYLADLQQRVLLPLVEGEPDLDVDASLAGWAYRTNSLRVEEDTSGGLTLWLPLVDGAERLGVLELRMETLDGVKLWRCR
ncbi:hypothetical protein ACWDO5_25360, partial [Streptomyces sp. NPDC000880]